MGNFARCHRSHKMYTFRYITRNFFDVFWGDGWDNCARIKRTKDGFVIIRAYKKPPKDFIKQITEESNATV